MQGENLPSIAPIDEFVYVKFFYTIIQSSDGVTSYEILDGLVNVSGGQVTRKQTFLWDFVVKSDGANIVVRIFPLLLVAVLRAECYLLSLFDSVSSVKHILAPNLHIYTWLYL
jgi:hypothetical protein